MSDKVHFRKELYLGQNIYGKQATLDDMEGMAQVIQNLIIVEQGTYPNTPNLGVGIENYLFELLDTETISDIQSSISNQVSTFVVSNSVNVEVKVSQMETGQANMNGIKIDVLLSDSFQNDTSKEIAFVFAGNSVTKRMVSKLILG